MIKLTEKEIATLLNIEVILHKAAVSNYVCGLDNATFNTLAIIYKRIYNYNGTLSNGCNSCVMNVCKGLYKVLQEYKQEKLLEDGKQGEN